uniref:Cadherin domain-containing protein n=1 Tax=Periophthalmus magnuspinnatus TaxID=409849 RepID=A0A3B3ZBH1_9GOBI
MAAVVSSFLLLCAFLCCADAFVEISPLEVLRGRSTFITSSHLNIHVTPGSDCKVEVVLNEPVTMRVGGVTTDGFYLLRFSSSETQVRTVVLPVLILDPPSPLVSLGPNPLIVPVFLGLSNPIDASVLQIRTGPDQICSVRFYSALVPAVGQLVDPQNSRNHGNQNCSGNSPCLDQTQPVVFLKTSCEGFLQSGLRYQHLSPPSPQMDYIPLGVELRERATRALLESEYVWIPVRINPGLPDQPPRASFMASSILEVDQFVLTPLTLATLDAEDAETPQSRLVFNVTAPPAGGYLTHLDDHTREVHSFTWDDLNHLKIAYQPPHTSQSQRTHDQMEFQVIDGSFQTSSPIVVHVSIRASETNAPRVSWNMGLVLLEGQSRSLSWEEFQVVDRDDIEQVFVVAVDGPQHGTLTVRGAKSFMFRVADLRRGDIVYRHDDSDTSHDHIVFRISDGRHTIRHRFPIAILPRDDSPPFLLNNVALQVQEGAQVQVRDYLLASDLDSSDQYITYDITTRPKSGKLVRKSSPQDTGVEVQSFLQKELVQGQIFYQHSGDETQEDSFDFSLSDNNEPPNLSQIYTVVVHVFPVKDQVPVEVPGSVRTLTLREDQVVYISPQQLHFRDPEDPDQDLTYTITRACYSTNRPSLMDAGRLFLTDNSNSMKRDHMIPVLKSFTQLCSSGSSAVNHMKVGFMPPVEDIGLDPLWVRFEFSVQDLQGGLVSGLDFNITVLPVDDQKPQAFSNLVRVEEGGAVLLTEEHVMVRDRDSPEDALSAHILKGALHGRLERQGHELRPGDSFSLMDLRSLRVRYVHDDSETTADEISLRISDGTNSVDLVLHVQILPMNDEAPVLDRFLLNSLVCNESGSVRISLDHLRASDRDSDDLRLVYMLARTPHFGTLQKSGLNVDRFTQQDLVQGLVYYSHSGAEIGPAPVMDTITLIISDAEAGLTDSCCDGDAPPPPVPLHGSLPVYDLNVTVLPVNNQPPIIVLGPSLLSVNEGSFGCLCGGVLGATDLDTPPDGITFHLLAPPLHGFIENTLPSAGSEKSRAGIPVESFTLTDLSGGFINYVQSLHRDTEPRADHMTLSVNDGLHSSAPSPVYIIINPTNDEPPVLHLNNFTVEEGGLQHLSPLLLDASDVDAPLDVLTFSVLRPPQHGRLLNALYKQQGAALSVEEFTLQELRQGLRLVYVHDGSETLLDSVELSLSDGKHSVLGTAFITVTPVDDQTPILIRNSGLEVDSGQTRVLSCVVLEAEDQDSDLDQVYYVLNTVPRQGALQKKSGSDWSVLYPGQNFTQTDVEMNRIRYVHQRKDHAEVTGVAPGLKGHDSFRFILSDRTNETPLQTFYISIRTMERGPLQLSTRPARIMEGERLVLSSDYLLALDFGPPQDLVYRIQDDPRLGSLSLVSGPGVRLRNFTQLDVTAQRVCYTHDNSHEGDKDSFSFVVSNGVSSVPGSLLVHILHMDRIPPSLVQNSGLRVQEGSTGIITRSHLLLTDPDTAVVNLTYKITQMPRYGRLLLHGEPLDKANRHFTQWDLDQAGVTYRHDPKTRASIDAFHFLPTDQSNAGFLLYGRISTEPAVFTIQIERPDVPPSLVSRLSPTAVTALASGRFGIILDRSHLQASDPDSEDQELTYTITRPPRHGHLENTLTGSYIQSRFTQRDINQKSVVYLLPVDVDVTNDNFLFVLSDPSWSSPGLFSASCYRTCETSGTLQIQVQRTGFSSDPAFVSIQVEEGGAKVGVDFTHSSATLLQFDPGVNVKTWNIFLIADALEENHESFTVLLKKPQNSVLGTRTSARVEILDPRQGPNKNTDTGRTCKGPKQSKSNQGPSTCEAKVLKSKHQQNIQMKIKPNLRNCENPLFRFNSSLASVQSRRDLFWLWRFSGRRPFWTGQCPPLTGRLWVQVLVSLSGVLPV